MTTAYEDFPAAMLGWLRAQPTIVSAFSEDASSLATTKFWPDIVQGLPPLPWAVYDEVASHKDFMTQAHGVTTSLEESTIRFRVVATQKQQARQLGRMIAKALEDPPLLFEDGVLMMMRPTDASFVPAGDIAVQYPGCYVRVVMFSVMIQRSSLTD